VPDRARLIIDGTIALGKASEVTLSIRIRNRLDGLVLETLLATAPGLAKIDSAAADLATRALPIVRAKLAALPPRAGAGDDHGHVTQTSRPPAADQIVLVATADATKSRPGALLLGALDAAVPGWTRAHHHQLQPLEPAKLAPKAVAAAAADLAIGFWILDYAPEAGALPMARARVRVRVVDASAVVFDRVVVTDTVLGDKGSSQPELAARVASEILAILRPHLRRRVSSWP
jgi:hypothetical protein